MTAVDRVIHEPARLRIMSVLAGVKEADFNFLVTSLGLTKGNLSSHMDRLEKAEYVHVAKRFNGKIPQTRYRATPRGRQALEAYWAQIEEIRSPKKAQKPQ